jgi:hypothetical protein
MAPVTGRDRIESLKCRALALQPLRNLALDTYKEVLKCLDADRKRLSLDESNIDILAKYAMAEAHVVAYQDAARQNFVYLEMQQAYADDLEGLDADTRQFDAETRALLDEMKKKHTEQRDQLDRQIQEDIQRHLDTWKSERHLKKYSHASVDLIVRRKQFEWYMRNKDYTNARACANEIHRMESSESQRAAGSIKVDFRESLRRLRIRQGDDIVALEGKVRAERELLILGRQSQRQVLVNVRKKLDSKEQAFHVPAKAWACTKPARMNSISKSIPPGEPLSPIVPAAPREGVRSRGRLQQQSQQIQLPHLAFEKF